MHESPASTPDVIDRLFRRFAGSLRPDRSSAHGPTLIALLMVALFAVLLAVSPRVMAADYTFDFFIPLDGALRALAGQWPHLDFYTPVGDLYYLCLGLAARIFGFTPKLVLWEQIIVLPFAVIATILATRDRLPASLRAFLIIMVGLICISPSDLDESSSLSFLASYNRHSWVFITPFLAACLLERPKERAGRGWLGDAILLFLLFLILFYLKMTFALVAGLTLALAALLVPGNRRSCLAAIAFIVVTLAIIWVSGPLMGAYWSDLHRASLASPISGDEYDPFRFSNLKAALTMEWFVLLAPICFAFWLGRTALNPTERRDGNRVLLICMIAAGGSIGLAWQNHEHSMPSQVIAMAIAFAAIWQRQMQRDRSISINGGMLGNWAPVILAALFFVFVTGVNIINSGRGIILHAARTTFDTAQPVATKSPYLEGLVVPVDTPAGVVADVLAGKLNAALYSVKSRSSWHNDLATILDDGWSLFQAHKPQDPKIVTLYSAPLMTVATKTEPPRHMAAWMDYERTFGARAPIVPERDFIDANVVMIFQLYDHEKLLDMVSDYLHANFHVVGETPIWQMWVRNGA